MKRQTKHRHHRLYAIAIPLVIGSVFAIATYLTQWPMSAPLSTAALSAEAPTPILTTGALSSGPHFTQDVLPILAARCAICHSTPQSPGGFQIASRDTVLTSGSHAPNVVPGDGQSRLLRLLRGEIVEGTRPMPPGVPLPAEDFAVIEQWIAAGAPE